MALEIHCLVVRCAEGEIVRLSDRQAVKRSPRQYGMPKVPTLNPCEGAER
jgi:hypothetical protein